MSESEIPAMIIPCEPGDIAAFPDGDGWIVGIVDQVEPGAVTVRWGDCCRILPRGVCWNFPWRRRPRSLGVIVGRRFPNAAALRRASDRHRLPEFCEDK